MNSEKVIKLTNRISFFSIILLIYWVFIFCSITVFEFKVFRENITQSFYLSIIGILALLTGAVIVNVMINLTKIAESIENRTESPKKTISKGRPILLISFLISFPLLFLILFYGDLSTSKRKERFLVDSAEYMVSNNKQIFQQLTNYTFDWNYIEYASNSLKILSKEDESFPSVSILIKDEIEKKEVYLKFGSYYYASEKEKPARADFIYPCSKGEREYLKEVFKNNNLSHNFSASDGKYELYYPVLNENNLVVLYFTDRQRYGKIGS